MNVVDDFVCAAAVSGHPDAAVAVGEVVGSVLERLDPHPDVAVLFVSGAMIEQLEQIVAAIEALLVPELLMGATVEAVFDSHGESVDGLAVWVLSSPVGLGAESLRLTEAAGGRIEGLPAVISPGAALLLFGDERFPLDDVVAELRARAEDVSLAAGLPPSRGLSQRFALINNDGIHRRGAVGLLMPRRAAAIFGFEVRIWDDDDPIPDPPMVPVDGRGAVLIAGRRVDVSGLASLDLEVLYDHLAGAVVGMIGRSRTYDGANPVQGGRTGGNWVTATVYGR